MYRKPPEEEETTFCVDCKYLDRDCPYIVKRCLAEPRTKLCIITKEISYIDVCCYKRNNGSCKYFEEYVPPNLSFWHKVLIFFKIVDEFYFVQKALTSKSK